MESAESRGLGSSSITYASSAALTLNPALAAGDGTHDIEVGIALTPNEQGLSDAYTAAVEGVYAARPIGLSFSLGASRLAYSTVYSDVDAIAGLAKRFDLAQGRSAAIGARFRYESLTTTPDYAPVKFYLLDLGFTFGISSEFSVAATALNLFGSGTRDGAGTVEERPVDLLFGAGYRPSDTPIAISATLESEESFGTTVHLGISYALVDALSLSAATTTDSGTISVGAHFKYDPALIDLGVRFDHAFGSVVTFGLTGQW